MEIKLPPRKQYKVIFADGSEGIIRKPSLAEQEAYEVSLLESQEKKTASTRPMQEFFISLGLTKEQVAELDHDQCVLLTENIFGSKKN